MVGELEMAIKIGLCSRLCVLVITMCESEPGRKKRVLDYFCDYSSVSISNKINRRQNSSTILMKLLLSIQVQFLSQLIKPDNHKRYAFYFKVLIRSKDEV